MTYLRRLELRLTTLGRTGEDAMDDMQSLQSVLMLPKSARETVRWLETPSKSQAEVLSALGSRIDEGGVLGRLES